MDLNNQTDIEILKIASPIMDNLIEGSTEKNWQKHTRNFTEGAKASLTENELLRQCESYQSSHGFFADREFIGITRHPEYINILWKQSMTKSAGEYIATLTLIQNDSEYQVIRCWVDLWEPKR